MGKVLIREYRDGDEARLLATLGATFGERRSPAAWRWSVAQNPAGTRCFVALEDGVPVACYVARPQPVWIDGVEHRFSQIIDAMVHPEARRRGLLVRTAEALFEAHGGSGGDVVFYGWPTRDHQIIGESHLAYERAQRQLALVRTLGDEASSAAGGGGAGIVVRAEAAFDEGARWLWERCCADWGASTVRDGAWLRWRYLDRPGAEYLVLGARDGEGSLRGLCVACAREWEGRDLALVADWLVPPGEPGVGHALLTGLEAQAAAWGSEALVAWIPAWSPWFVRFQESGFRVRPTAWDLVVRSFQPRFDGDFLRSAWWYQLGDSDLV